MHENQRGDNYFLLKQVANAKELRLQKYQSSNFNLGYEVQHIAKDWFCKSLDNSVPL
jgi:hypothetical protein